MSEKRRGSNRFNNTIVLGIMMAMSLVMFLIIMDTRDLKDREQDLTAQEELLERKIEEESLRTEELLEQKSNINSPQHIEKIAREKLGLLSRDEILIKEKNE